MKAALSAREQFFRSVHNFHLLQSKFLDASHKRFPEGQHTLLKSTTQSLLLGLFTNVLCPHSFECAYATRSLDVSSNYYSYHWKSFANGDCLNNFLLADHGAGTERTFYRIPPGAQVNSIESSRFYTCRTLKTMWDTLALYSIPWSKSGALAWKGHP